MSWYGTESNLRTLEPSKPHRHATVAGTGLTLPDHARRLEKVINPTSHLSTSISSHMLVAHGSGH